MGSIKAPTDAGKRVNELIIRNRMSPEQATIQVLGNLKDRYSLPQGSVILEGGLNDLIYKDAQGYTHRIQREGDANSPNFGQVRELQTDRPAVLPLTDQIAGLSGALQAAIQAVNSGLSGNLATLTPQNESELNAISENERAQLNQEANLRQGELVTGLYGQGVNRSSIANDAAAQFAQAVGIALGNQAANAAQRKLDLQKFVTQLATGTGLDVLNNVSGQETSRANTSAQIGLGKEQLNQQSDEAARNFLLEWQKFQASQKKSILPSILSAVATIGGGLLGGPAGAAIGGAIGKKIGGTNTIASGSLPEISFSGLG